MLSNIDIVLNNNTANNEVKTTHSFFEKEEKTKFISYFLGNLKLRM